MKQVMKEILTCFNLVNTQQNLTTFNTKFLRENAKTVAFFHFCLMEAGNTKLI